MSLFVLALCFVAGYIFKDLFKFLIIVAAGVAFLYYYQGMDATDLFNALVKVIDYLKELAI